MRLFIICICILHCSQVFAQKNAISKPDALDSMNMTITKTVVKLLEQRHANKAFGYFRPGNSSNKGRIIAQLDKISKDLQAFKTKAKFSAGRSYKNYKDSFNIDRIIYYDMYGYFYIFEFFYLKGDASSKVVDIFVRNPAQLAIDRKEEIEFRKKNPDAPPGPPKTFPPGVYLKERDH